MASWGEFDPAAVRARIAANQRVLIVIAGPNGAGKSTFFAEVIQPLGLQFVNADILAKARWPAPSKSPTASSPSFGMAS